MRRRAGAGGGELDRPLVCFDIGDELRQRVHRKILRHDDRARRLDGKSKRREVAQRFVRRVLVERLAPAMGTVVAEHELRAVRCGARHAERADGAARASRIFNHDGLTQSVLQALREDAARDVARSAGGERHDQRQGAALEGLRLNWRNEPGSQERQRQKEKSTAQHRGLLLSRDHGRTTGKIKAYRCVKRGWNRQRRDAKSRAHVASAACRRCERLYV